jgi:hypothetical protein
VAKKIDELSYGGFQKLCEWVHDKLGIDEIMDFPSRRVLIASIEVRNCIVHNRCKVGSKLLRTLAMHESSPLNGRKIETGFDAIYLSGAASAQCVAMLDTILANKFSLPTISR